MIMNEKIKASEVYLTGVNGEDLGLVATKDALRMAKELKVDLICLSLAESPPRCQLVGQASLKTQLEKEKKKERKEERGVKIKEIRLGTFIEEHDYDTKKRQAERILTSGDAVQITVRPEKKESQAAVKLVERLAADLLPVGKKETGIQVSGKQVTVVVRPALD